MITVSAVHVGDGVYGLDKPLRVAKQAALHKVAHPWSLMGLRLADVSHSHG
jgi:hypothetical protein